MPNEPDDLHFSDDHGRRSWAARADPVFVSGLQRRDEPNAGQVRLAAGETIGLSGCPGCVGQAAREFCGHPKTAVIRMCRLAQAAVSER